MPSPVRVAAFTAHGPLAVPQILLAFYTLGDGEGAMTCWPGLLVVVLSTARYLHSATALGMNPTLTQRDTCHCWPSVPKQRWYDAPVRPLLYASLKVAGPRSPCTAMWTSTHVPYGCPPNCPRSLILILLPCRA